MSAEKIAVFPQFAEMDRLRPYGYAWTTHQYTAMAGTVVDDVLATAYWARVARKLHLYDKIVVVEESGQWYAELLVVAPGTEGVKVCLLFGKQLDGNVGVNDASMQNFTGCSVKYRGPHLKWCIVDREGKILHEKCDTEAIAYGWLNQHVKTVQK